jgi:hypothetical protein
MRSRSVALLATIALLLALGAPTLYVLARQGVSWLLILSVLILAFIIIGVLGALWSPPPEE